MPEFEVISRQEAMARSDTGKRSQTIREYVEYVDSLGPDQAGRITLLPGETVPTVRRRLGAAIKATGRSIQIKRVGADIYFWKTLSRGEGGAPARTPPPKSYATRQAHDAFVIFPPAGDGAVCPHPTHGLVPGADRGELPLRRRGLAKAIIAPAGDGAVHPHPASVLPTPRRRRRTPS